MKLIVHSFLGHVPQAAALKFRERGQGQSAEEEARHSHAERRNLGKRDPHGRPGGAPTQAQERKVQEQGATISQLKSTVAQQQKDFLATAAQQQEEIRALSASLKEQAFQIQKVSAQLQLSKPAPQMAGNDR